ncbi:hypothetical protein FE697_013145 [Mumia zhuanghuii]|uniref:Integral membrane protein n=2 Tax=Mumia TaxID=1546255 RepID=A0ABW1QQ74_9ACTN|nr:MULTISPECIES: hypothetical protein [Mumia]KAA1422128.1 hypothetical protein FE697_013145 [Mumia zhuanghuii]
MSSVLRIPGHPSEATVVVISMAATAVLGATGINVLLTTSPARAGYLAAAVAAGGIALCCFAGAIALLRLTGCLRPALWGYLPGLAAVLAAGLLVSEHATRGATDPVAPAVGALVLLLPSTWIPIYAAVHAHLESRREDAAVRSWRGRI